MTKEKLLNLLNGSLKTEESASPLYIKHISSTLFLSGFDTAKQERIVQILGIMHNESNKHRNMLMQLINKIKNEDNDVY